MNQEQFASAIEGKDEQRDVNARAVQNGYIITGLRRFLEPSTAAVVLQQNVETVASDADEAATLVSRFLINGTFNA